jgi:hypothetical protein
MQVGSAFKKEAFRHFGLSEDPHLLLAWFDVRIPIAILGRNGSDLVDRKLMVIYTPHLKSPP